MTAAIGVVIITGLVFANADAKLVVGSAFLVTAGVIFTGAVKLHSEERDRAYRFLTEHVNSTELMRAVSYIGQLRERNGGTITAEQAQALYTSRHAQCGMVRSNIHTACNFFEEMAISVRSRQINEYIVKEFYVGLLYRVGGFVRPILPIIRNDPKIAGHIYGDISKPEVYENMFWLWDRWSPEYESYYLTTPDDGLFSSFKWTGRS